MMNGYCTNCGAALPEGMKFCTSCGVEARKIPSLTYIDAHTQSSVAPQLQSRINAPPPSSSCRSAVPPKGNWMANNPGIVWRLTLPFGMMIFFGINYIVNHLHQNPIPTSSVSIPSSTQTYPAQVPLTGSSPNTTPNVPVSEATSPNADLVGQWQGYCTPTTTCGAIAEYDSDGTGFSVDSDSGQKIQTYQWSVQNGVLVKKIHDLRDGSDSTETFRFVFNGGNLEFVDTLPALGNSPWLAYWHRVGNAK